MAYTQCLLVHGNVTQVSWLPTMFARRNCYLTLKSEDGKWSNGWLVAETYGTIPESQLPDSHNDIKQHKMNTGDVTRKRKAGA